MNQHNKLSGDILSLDLGEARTGVARINTAAKLSEPLAPISMDDNFAQNVQNLVDEYGSKAVVAGIPRGLDGQSTQQTNWALSCVEQLRTNLHVPIFTIDEAGTTKKAEERAFKHQSIDSVAACIIAEDFITELELGRIENASI